MEIILATHNTDKVQEFKTLLNTGQIDLLPISTFGIDMQVEETGQSYRENALIKAEYAHRKLPGKAVLADDSGLSIDVLSGYPGIYSARFAGVDTAYPDKIKAIWHLLEPYEKTKWQAAFCCALAYIDEQGKTMVFEAECKGIIIPEMRGKNGFGYDPVFYMPQFQMTTAEMAPELKNQISHRGQAVELWKQYLLGLDKKHEE